MLRDLMSETNWRTFLAQRIGIYESSMCIESAQGLLEKVSLLSSQAKAYQIKNISKLLASIRLNK